MDDIFEGAVEEASKDLENSGGSVDLSQVPEELQEQYRTIESLVSMNPDVVNSEDYKDLIAKIEAHGSTQASDEEDEEEDEDEDIEGNSNEDEEDEEDEDENEEDEDIEDVFGLIDSKSKSKSKKVKLDFEVPDEMNSLLKDKYGIEDASTFFGSVDAWRTQAQAGADVKKEYDALTSDIQSLPPDLRESLKMWADGEDYTSVFEQGGRLDFSSDFEEQDVEGLVEHYLNDEYVRLVNEYESNENMSDDDFDGKMDMLARSTRKLFTQEKKALVESRVQYEDKQANLHKNLKNSALDSVEKLSEAYPNFSKVELNKVKHYLVEGKVDSLFYNADGTYTEEAAKLVANALYGEKVLKTVKTLAKRKGESEANMRTVDSSPKSVRKSKLSQGKKANVSAVQHLSSVVVDNDPYA